MQELQHLSAVSDYFHLGPEDLGAVPVRNVAYREGDKIIDWGKTLFRLDEWDKKALSARVAAKL